MPFSCELCLSFLLTPVHLVDQSVMRNRWSMLFYDLPHRGMLGKKDHYERSVWPWIISFSRQLHIFLVMWPKFDSVFAQLWQTVTFPLPCFLQNPFICPVGVCKYSCSNGSGLITRALQVAAWIGELGRDNWSCLDLYCGLGAVWHCAICWFCVYTAGHPV